MQNRIFLIGFMGSGKTTMGKRIASRMDFQFIDLDNYIAQEYKMNITQIFDLAGEKQFRLWEQNCLEQLVNRENIVVATGGGTPCFHSNMDLINQNGLSIYLKLTPKALYSRLSSARVKRPLLQGKKEDELLNFISELLDKRKKYYEQSKYHVDALYTDIGRISELIQNS